MPAALPTCKQIRRFLVHHAPRYSAPLTGVTNPLLDAFIHLAEARCRADSTKEPHILAAMRAVLAAEPEQWDPFRLSIVGVGDWGHLDTVWPKLLPPTAPSPALVNLVFPGQVEGS